ncbi:SIS domain-containing protein [bacterium]|nr:SIS domain-containing protein [bacterium]
MESEIAKDVKIEIERTLAWMREQIPKINNGQLRRFAKRLLDTLDKKQRIFVTGVGRSGEVAKSVAMRLSHLGFDVRVLGEPTMPPVEKDNLFIVISGGGEHQVDKAKIAKDLGAVVIAITSQSNSSLGKIADEILLIPGRPKRESSYPYEERRIRGIPVMPLNTDFEDLTLIVLDSLLGYIGALTKKSDRDLEKRHAKPE